MKRPIFILLFCAMLFGSHQSFAQAPLWDFDKVHSNFYFAIDHIFSRVHGHFRDYSGTVAFDPKNLAESKLIFDIKVDSIFTDNTKRDKHLLSEDFFNEAAFPSIRFESDKITETGGNTYNVQGKFTVKGKEYNLSFPLSLAGIKEHPAMKGTLVAGFNGNLTIDRLAYGVGTGKFLDYGVVGRNVDILISLEVLRKQ